MLFVGAAAGFDAGSSGSKKCSCGTDGGEDCGWIFWGVGAAVLGMEREGNGKKQS